MIAFLSSCGATQYCMTNDRCRLWAVAGFCPHFWGQKPATAHYPAICLAPSSRTQRWDGVLFGRSGCVHQGRWSDESLTVSRSMSGEAASTYQLGGSHSSPCTERCRKLVMDVIHRILSQTVWCCGRITIALAIILIDLRARLMSSLL